MDLKAAFMKLRGRVFRYSEFRNAVVDIRAENLGNLPPQVDVEDLIFLARKRHWLREGEDGGIEVAVQGS